MLVKMLGLAVEAAARGVFFCQQAVHRPVAQVLLQVGGAVGGDGIYFRHLYAFFAEKVGIVQKGFVFADVGIHGCHAGAGGTF